MNKIQVVDKNLHEIKDEIIGHYAGKFEMFGKLSVGDQFRETHIRFRNTTDYEHYINAFDGEFDAEGAFFNGYIFKVNTPQFNLVNRCQYGNGCGFNHRIIEYQGSNCFIPTKGYCSVKNVIIIQLAKIIKKLNLTFFRKEKRRSKS